MKRIYKRKIDWYLTEEMLNQAYRAGLEYAFVSRNFKQICPFVLCKDFLQDALQSYLCGIRCQIHGFIYDPQIHKPIYTKKLRIIIACSKDLHFRDRIHHMLDFLNQIEDILHIKRTTIRECAKPPEKYKAGGIWLLESHKRWMISPPMLSMYTLMIRIGLVHTIGDKADSSMFKVQTGLVKGYGRYDKGQMKAARKGVDCILRLGDKKIFSNDMRKNYPAFVSLKDMHKYMGIVGFSKKYTKHYMLQWHKEY